LQTRFPAMPGENLSQQPLWAMALCEQNLLIFQSWFLLFLWMLPALSFRHYCTFIPALFLQINVDCWECQGTSCSGQKPIECNPTPANEAYYVLLPIRLSEIVIGKVEVQVIPGADLVWSAFAWILHTHSTYYADLSLCKCRQFSHWKNLLLKMTNVTLQHKTMAKVAFLITE
jgi:hypothetical protein